MALTKTRTQIPQLTAAGQSSPIAVAASYRHSVYIRHANGSGTISAGASVKVQVQSQGASNWYDLLALAFGTTVSAVETRVVPLPDDASSIRLDYVAPSGSTGHTLDAEVGQITAY